MKNNQKYKAYNFGVIAEALAMLFLRFKFYQIIARRFRSPFGEIDIVAKKGKQIIFVEIKARRDTSLMDFISKRQQNRITSLPVKSQFSNSKLGGNFL